MKIKLIKNEIEFVKSFLPKRAIEDNLYNFNYIKIEPADNPENMLISATDGYRMSSIELPNIFELTEPVFIHKDTDFTKEVKIETDVKYPNTKSILIYLQKQPKACFNFEPKLIEFTKELKKHQKHYDNPKLTFTFNPEGIFLSQVEIKDFKLTSDMQVLRTPVDIYNKSLSEPFTFSINALFLEQALEKYLKSWGSLHECKIIETMLVIEAEGYKKKAIDFIASISN